ncbi:hypothetical protein LMG26858_06243 [Achromobacter anxifer]|uniref:Uncharacterized protein n=1 Tax=Achromobacter anxifer TaxID=1287737 RepID=A0A6S7EUE0_9BURK|nr:hypothetical protein LMG26858_06243 [Achromobacter anxifer]
MVERPPSISEGVAMLGKDAVAPDISPAPAWPAACVVLPAIAPSSCTGLRASPAMALALSSMLDAPSAAVDRPLDMALAPLASAAPALPSMEPCDPAAVAAAGAVEAAALAAPDAPAAFNAWPEAACACSLALGRCTSSAVTIIGSPTWVEGRAGSVAASLAGPIRLCDAPLTENMPGPLNRMSPPSRTMLAPAACRVMVLFARISMLSVVEVTVTSWPASISSMSVCAWIDTGDSAATARMPPSCTNRLVERPEALAKVWRAATWPSACAVTCRFSLACRMAEAGVAKFSDEGASISMRAPAMRSTASVPPRSPPLALTACWPPTLPG